MGTKLSDVILATAASMDTNHILNNERYPPKNKVGSGKNRKNIKKRRKQNVKRRTKK